MQKSVHGTVFLSILSLLISYNLVFASVLKTEALEQKTYEISSLRVKIIDKIDQAVEMRARLEHELADLQGEIQSEQIRAGIYSYQEALQNLRIRFNLSLIQVLQSYVKQLNERIAYFQKGNEHLRFLALQIKDDIALINTLKDMETDNLNGRINRVLDEFIPETKKPIFNVTGIRLLSIERVWNETSIKFRLN
jgi:chromosome condensin MukBEF ATPase and DNA-binding subunit MukB